MAKITGDILEMDSGKCMMVHRGIVGINQEFELYHGYDGIIRVGDDEFDDITNQDALELCEFMISHWKQYRDELKKY